MSTAPYAVPTPPATVRTVLLPQELADRPLLSLLPRGIAHTSWVTTDTGGGDPGLVGWGEAARAELGGAERFSRAQRWWSAWLADADVDDAIGVPGSGPVAFASFAFDPTPGTSVIVVPSVVVGRRDGVSWLTVVADSPRSARHAIDETVAALR